jgi:iron complex outermembrane receptor protein
MRKLLLISVSSTALFLAGAAAAQTAASAPNASATSGVQEIVVTATRRAVDLQRVTATVEAVPAATLKTYNINGVGQLTNLVPGFVVQPSGGNNIYLRGIGSGSTGYNEAQAAVYLDGLYLANPATGIYSFNNIDQIEVLKGPQGTLYGRNATAGLISITTRSPGATQRLDAEVGYASYNTVSANLYASTPITDTLAANIAIFHQKQSKGWGINTFTGHDNQKTDETGLESKLVWRPSSGTKVTGTFVYDYNNRDIGYAYEVYPGTLGADGTPFLGKYRNASRIDPSSPFHSYIGSLKIEQDLGFANLMSLTGYQRSNETTTFAGGSPILGQPVAGQGVTGDIFYEHNRTLSQEFQLTSKPSDSRLDWVGGFFYYNDHSELRLDAFTTCVGAVCTPGFTPNRSDGFPATFSYSGYGDATYRFFDATRLTVGLRYTDERRTLSGLNSALPGYPNSVAALPITAVVRPGQPFAGSPTGIPTELHFTKWTYRIVLAQDFGEHIHAYVSNNLGFKSGAYNANLFINPPAQPEILNAYEAGVKSELFDRMLRLNLSYFRYNYNDVQVRSIAPPAPPGNALLENAAKEHMYGLDADFVIAAIKNFTINGGFEFLTAKYVSFPGTTCTTIGTRVVNGVTIGATTTLPCNLAGYSTPNSPRFSGTLGFAYTLDTGAGPIVFSANDHYNVRYAMVGDHAIYQNAHHIVDASARWTSPSKHFDVQVWGRNLGKAYYYAVSQEAASFAIVPGAPRTFGVTVGYHY